MSRLAALAVAALAVAALVGCGPAAAPRAPAVIRTTITLPGTPSGPGASGELVGAVERGDVLYLFARDRVVIERGGAVLATAAAPDGGWAEAVAMPGLDVDASAWVVGRTQAGALWRVTQAGDLEPIHDRLGLPPAARAIAASPATAAIALADGLAILRDRRHVARFAEAAPAALAAGAGRIAIRRGDAIEAWTPAAERRVAYAVPGAIAAAFTGARGDQLAVATPDALYLEDAGRLRRIAPPAEIRGLAAAGSRLWVVTRGGVALLDGRVLVLTAVQAAAADHLFGLAGGDLVLAARGSATRLAVADVSDVAHDDEARWRAAVAPVVRRVCSRCHDPGGRGGVERSETGGGDPAGSAGGAGGIAPRGIDLSTVAAWRAERGELIRRVLDARTMPPPGTDLDDADRRALAGWLLAGHAAP